MLQLLTAGSGTLLKTSALQRSRQEGVRYQRVAKRQTDFVCFAAREVEEIEISFADGLALPNRLEGTTIDNRYLSYRSSYDLVDRTLKVRREFTSNVGGQVCDKEVEAEISGPLQRVARSLGAQMMFSTSHQDPAAALDSVTIER